MKLATRVKLLQVLTLIFIILKLTNVTDWSWWLVLAPTLVPLFCLLLVWVIAWAIVSKIKSVLKW